MHKYKKVSVEECSSCGSTINTFRHYMNATLVAFMDLLPSDGTETSVRELYKGSLKASPDAGYLIHWRLIQRTKRGWYRITPDGTRFLSGKLKVWAWVDARLKLRIDNSTWRIGVDEARKVF